MVKTSTRIARIFLNSLGAHGWDFVRCIRDGVAGYVARRSAADEAPKETAGPLPLARYFSIET